jgi:ankyrin repeat protein
VKSGKNFPVDVDYLIKCVLKDSSFQTQAQKAQAPVWNEYGTLKFNGLSIQDYFTTDLVIHVCARKDEVSRGSCTIKLRDLKTTKESITRSCKVDKNEVTIMISIRIKEETNSTITRHGSQPEITSDKKFSLLGGLLKKWPEKKQEKPQDLNTLLKGRSLKTEQESSIANQLEMIKKIKNNISVKDGSETLATQKLRSMSTSMPTLKLEGNDMNRESTAFFTSPRSPRSPHSDKDQQFYAMVKDIRDFEEYSEILKDESKWITWKSHIDGSNLLHKCALYDNVEMIGKLLDLGLDPNAMDKKHATPLMVAASGGNRDICLNLLGRGAKISSKDLYGYTPLTVALKHHHFHLVDDLVLFGGDVNFKRDNGMTILHESLTEGDEEMLDVILKLPNLKLNLKDQNGKTPLLRACEKAPVTQFIKFLNKDGVDTSAHDDFGRSFLNLLVRYGRQDVLDYFPQDRDTILKYAKLFDERDSGQKIPLHHAVEKGNFGVLKSLCFLYNDLKINFDVKDADGLTPYGLAFKILNKVHAAAMKLYRNKSPEEVLKLINQDIVGIEEFLKSYEKK